MINIQKSNINNIEKQEIENWTINEVKVWLNNLKLNVNQTVDQIQLNGKKLLEMDFERLIDILGVTDQNTKNILFHSLTFKQQQSKLLANQDLKSKKSYTKELLSRDSFVFDKENPDKNMNDNLIEEEEKDNYSDDGNNQTKKDRKINDPNEDGGESSNIEDSKQSNQEFEPQIDKEAQLKNQQDNFLQCNYIIFKYFL